MGGEGTVATAGASGATALNAGVSSFVPRPAQQPAPSQQQPQAAAAHISAGAAPQQQRRQRGGRGGGRGRGGDMQPSASFGGRPASAAATQVETAAAAEGTNRPATAPNSARQRKGDRGRGRGGGERSAPASAADVDSAAATGAPGAGGGAAAGGGRGRGEGARKGGAKTARAPKSDECVQDQGGAAATVAVRRQPLKLQKGMTEHSAELTRLLHAQQYECAICYEHIRVKQDVWHCNSCAVILHIQCARQWCSQTPGSNWPCPICRIIMKSKPQASCFCGKDPHPKYDGYLPHSCGEVCGKIRLGTTCPHPCLLVCHPGKCPPCTRPSPPRPCLCGKVAYASYCGSIEPPRDCGQICDKPRDCGIHKCDRTCHDGACDGCTLKKELNCFCGKTSHVLSCVESAKSCGKLCERTLSCGNHTCREKCHDGVCPPCKLQPDLVTSCGCGKAALSSLPSVSPRQSCADPIASCGEVCNKVLACGAHRCEQICHNGDCPPCLLSQTFLCRCATKKVFNIKCTEVARSIIAIGNPPVMMCARPCNAKIICGNHKCNTKCCPRKTHDICELACGKKLGCGRHRCKLACHFGPCRPCLQATMEEVTCGCGASVLYPPVACGTPAPTCNRECNRPRPCGHPALHACHTDENCALCTFMITKKCVCGKRDFKTQCSRNANCGIMCRKLLPCGMHTCTRVCHAGPCVSTPTTFSSSLTSAATKAIDAVGGGGGGGEEGEQGGGGLFVDEREDAQNLSCGQKCGKNKQCGHICVMSCHPGVSCTKECDKKLVLRCHCGRITREEPCSGEATPRLSCDEECLEAIQVAERNARLAAVMHVDKDLSHWDREKQKYSLELMLCARADLPQVVKFEKKLAELVASKPRPGTTSSSMPSCLFPAMPTSERHLLQSMAACYLMDVTTLLTAGGRALEITCNSRSVVPPVLLSVQSQAQKLTSASDFELLAEFRQDLLHFYDLSVDETEAVAEIHRCLKLYQGDYRIRKLVGAEFVALFDNPAQVLEAAQQLGGAVRGKFRVRLFPPRAERPPPATAQNRNASVMPTVASVPVKNAWAVLDRE